MSVVRSVLMASNLVLMVIVNLAPWEHTGQRVSTWLVKDVPMVSPHPGMIDSLKGTNKH